MCPGTYHAPAASGAPLALERTCVALRPRTRKRFFRMRGAIHGTALSLFRRAIEQGNQYAWELIYTQYSSLVAGWVKNHPNFRAIDGETQEYVNPRIPSLWTATSNKFDQFTELSSLLAYLKMCVHSAITDETRKVSRAAVAREWDLPDESVAASSAKCRDFSGAGIPIHRGRCRILERGTHAPSQRQGTAGNLQSVCKWTQTRHHFCPAWETSLTPCPKFIESDRLCLSGCAEIRN